MLDDKRRERETVSQAGNSEPSTTEAEALAAALNHSAERVQTLWFSFLTFMLYLAVAIGTTTHRMLFLESPLNLPVLNIALPLLGFYILTPIIFVVFHFYMLLNLVLLARTAKSFEDALVRAFPEDGEARENFRMRIENTLFVQPLVGAKPEREGVNAMLLSLIAWITLVVAPFALLLMTQIMFLPYHSPPITNLHRWLLMVDLLFVIYMWSRYQRGWALDSLNINRWVFGLALGFPAYAMLVATFPGDLNYFLGKWLLGHWYDWATPVNTLVLRGEDLIDDEKLAHIIAKNEGATGEQRWVPTLSLVGPT